MKKALCIINDQDEIKDLLDQLESLRVQMNERVGFLQKQADNYSKKTKEDGQKIWDNISDILLQKKLITDQEIKDLCIHFDPETKVIFTDDPKDCAMDPRSQFMDALKGLFR